MFFSFSGCTSASDTVSKEEYESVVAEVDGLKSQIESMQNDKGDINIEISASSTNAENSESLSSDEKKSNEKV